MTVKYIKENLYEAILTEKELKQLKNEILNESSIRYSEYSNISIIERKDRAVAVKMIIEG